MAWECFGIPQDELESVAERGRGTSGIPWLVHLPRDLTFGNWKTTNRWMMTVYCINHDLCFHFLQRSKRSLDRNICNVLQNTKPLCTTVNMGAPGPAWKLLTEICYFTMQKISTVYAQILQQKTKQKLPRELSRFPNFASKVLLSIVQCLGIWCTFIVINLPFKLDFFPFLLLLFLHHYISWKYIFSSVPTSVYECLTYSTRSPYIIELTQRFDYLLAKQYNVTLL